MLFLDLVRNVVGELDARNRLDPRLSRVRRSRLHRSLSCLCRSLEEGIVEGCSIAVEVVGMVDGRGEMRELVLCEPVAERRWIGLSLSKD